MRLELFSDSRTLDRVRPEWDELAEHRALPCCAPLWMLSWWHHFEGHNSRARFIAGFDDDDRLCGIAPFFAERNAAGLWCYRILGAGTSQRVEPIARSGYEEEFAVGVARQLARCDPLPALIRLEGIPASSPWPDALRTHWPAARSPFVQRVQSMGLPTVSIEGTFDEWFARRTSNFRQQMRRSQRQLAAKGAVIQRARTSAELHEAVRELRRLHDRRWKARGGSAVMNAQVEGMLVDVVEADRGPKPLQLWVIRTGDRIISSQAFLSAGGETTYWLGGFDDAWGRFRPSILTILAVIEDAFARGDKKVDLGGGTQPYKQRFSDGEDVLEWWVIVPPGRMSVPARAMLASARGRKLAADALPPDIKRRVKRIVRR